MCSGSIVSFSIDSNCMFSIGWSFWSPKENESASIFSCSVILVSGWCWVRAFISRMANDVVNRKKVTSEYAIMSIIVCYLCDDVYKNGCYFCNYLYPK